MNCILSICIPTFNRAGLLDKALRSILPQSSAFEDVEVLIVDNASTDETGAIARGFADTYPRVRYRRNATNEGFDGNVLRCLEHSAGEYTWFFSDDDFCVEGTVKRVRDTLAADRPSILYLSHYGFENDDPHTRTRVLCPETDKVFAEGKEFFLYAGLGFITALIVKTGPARAFMPGVRRGKACAHLDIASRLSLTSKGPFVYLGTCPIAGRAPAVTPSSYDLLEFGIMNVDQLYNELVQEHLLTEKEEYAREERQLKSLIPRLIVSQMVLGDRERLLSHRKELKELYGSHPEYWTRCAPLFYLPWGILSFPYKTLRAAVRYIRKKRYN